MTKLFEAFPSYLSPLFPFNVTKPLILNSLIWLPPVLFLATAIYLSLLFKTFLNHLKKSYVLLEIKPPTVTLQSAFSTRQLLNILHSLDHKYSFLEKILNIKSNLSFEIVSTKESGIRYLIYAPQEDVSVIKKIIRSYLPAVEINEVKDYLSQSINLSQNKNYLIEEYQLAKSFVLPLLEQDILSQYDPIAYLTGQMTKLEKDELIAFQIISTPITPKFHGSLLEYTHKLNKRILEGKEVLTVLNNNFFNGVLFLFSFVFSALLEISRSLSNWLMDFFIPSRNGVYFVSDIFPLNRTKEKIKDLSPKQLQVQAEVEKKINQNLFETSIRLFIIGATDNNINLRRNGISSSIATFNNTNVQSIKTKGNFPLKLDQLKKWNYLKLKNRLLSLTNNPILSVSELSSIFHFPYTSTTQTEDLQSVKSVQLPAPVSFKKEKVNFDITFAQNIHGESITPIGLTLEERRRHTYIIGATGMGKTTLLMQMIHRDIVNSKGLAVIDPHGDLTQKILGVIPEKRIKDVVYFNPYDIDYPIGLNVLELSKTGSEAESQREKDLIASSIVSIFHKLYPARYSGPRMEHILRNAILTALELKSSTLFTVYKLLTDKNFRKQAVDKLDDTVLKEFWKNEFEKLGSYQKAEQISPITNKLGRFLTSSLTRLILNQEKSKLDFDRVMNDGKILVCDLSKGKIGEDISAFLGSLVIAKLQLAALKRIHLAEDKRPDFFLYIDEFQNFATQTFAQILSEARKYRLNTILAHQTISQIEDKDLLKIILANVGTVISFRTSNPSDEEVILPIFSPKVKIHEIQSLPAYNFYIKVNSLESQDSFTATTDNFAVPSYDSTREKVIKFSQKKYGKKFNTSLKNISESFNVREKMSEEQIAENEQVQFI